MKNNPDTASLASFLRIPEGMRKVFSFHRFSAYLKLLWAEQWRTYLMKTGIMFGVLLLMSLWISSLVYPEMVRSGNISETRDPAEELLFVVMAALFLPGGCVAGSEMLHGARGKGERVMALTIPVTPFENWLARWCMCVPLYIASFLSCMYIVDTVRILLFSSLYPDFRFHYIDILSFDMESSHIRYLWVIYLYVTGIYVLGSVFFPRKALLKTSAFVFLMFWLMVLLQVSLYFGVRSVGGETAERILEIFGWLSIPFLWCLSYWRFKELEVIDRF